MSNNLQFTQRRLSAPMLFSALPDQVQQELRDQSPLRSFDDGQLIQQRGDAPKGFWLIDQGSVAVGQFLRDGEFRGVALLGPGDSWGELAMFAERPRVVDAIAALAPDVSAVEGGEAKLAELTALAEALPDDPRYRADLPWDTPLADRVSADPQLAKALELLGG